MKKKTRGNPWRVGATLILVNDRGLPFKPEASAVLALVVDGREDYPKLRDHMLSKISVGDLEANFVCVEWVKNDKFPAGYYAKARFKPLSKLNPEVN